MEYDIRKLTVEDLLNEIADRFVLGLPGDCNPEWEKALNHIKALETIAINGKFYSQEVK